MTDVREDRKALFGKLQSPETQPQFWARVADDVSTSTTIDGAPFVNTYCWVCRFDADTIVNVRAYVDSTMVAYTILRNEQA